MAIQNRRGAYTNFNPTKMLPGEYAIVLSGDPDGSSGYAVYMCFGSSVVKRLILDDDLTSALADLTITWSDISDAPTSDTTLSVVGGFADAATVGLTILGNIAAGYDASSAYAVGAYCVHSNQLYRCTTAIGSGGEAWNSNHWTAVTLASEIDAIELAWSAITGKPSIDAGTGSNSIVENQASQASGSSSHAEGIGTIANHKSQHVFGEYNTADGSSAAATARGNYVEIVGKGTGTSARSNARTLDWSGNEVLAGGLTAGGNVSSSGNVSATGTLSSGGNATVGGALSTTGNATVGGDLTVSGGDLTLGSTALSQSKLSSILSSKVKCTDANSDGNVVISFENFS